MSELRDFAQERLVKRVQVQLPGRDAPTEVLVRVPVGGEAVEYLRDVRGVMAANDALAGLVDMQDDASEPGYQGAVGEAADALQRAVSELWGKWLPRLVDELDGLTERQATTLVRRTGGPDSPLAQALYDLVPASVGPGEEGLDAIPFS